MVAALGTPIAGYRQPQTLGRNASLCIVGRRFMTRVYPRMLNTWIQPDREPGCLFISHHPLNCSLRHSSSYAGHIASYPFPSSTFVLLSLSSVSSNFGFTVL
jgi:hypothetical protein